MCRYGIPPYWRGPLSGGLLHLTSWRWMDGEREPTNERPWLYPTTTVECGERSLPAALKALNQVNTARSRPEDALRSRPGPAVGAVPGTSSPRRHPMYRVFNAPRHPMYLRDRTSFAPHARKEYLTLLSLWWPSLYSSAVNYGVPRRASTGRVPTRVPTYLD